MHRVSQIKIVWFCCLGIWFLCAFAKEKPPSFLLGEIDQVIPYNNQLLLIRYSPLEMYRWNSQIPKVKLQSTSVFLPGELGKLADPIYWARGQFQNHLVVDRIQKNIWQLDSNLQILSRLPLPKELEGLLEQYQIFWLEGRHVLFLNPRLGIGHRYIQRNNGWWHQVAFKIPLGYNRCYLGFSIQEDNQEQHRGFMCLSSNKKDFFDWEWSRSKEFTWEKNKQATIFQSSHRPKQWVQNWELIFKSPNVVQYKLHTQKVKNKSKNQIKKNESLCYHKESRRVYLCL